MLPLILGFFLLAALIVGGTTALAQAFVQQSDLQDVCDGAAAAAAASSGDLNRGASVASGRSLRFDGAGRVVEAYLARDPDRRSVTAGVTLAADGQHIVVHCRTVDSLVFGRFIGKEHVVHTATSTSRAAVIE